MASCDYKSCDICGAKTFYDANVHYDESWDESMRRPPRVGAWAVLCAGCADTHEVVIVKRGGPKPESEGG